MINKLLVVFDLDHTLLKINSHYDFAEAFLARRARLWFAIYRLFSGGLVGRIVTRLVGDDARKWLSLRIFGFFSQEELETAARSMYQSCEESLFHSDVMRLFRSLKESDRHHVVLMTATPDFIARVFAERLDVAFHASAYAKGRLNFDLTGQKVERALEMSQFQPHLFVSDNAEDINDAFPNYVLVKDGQMYWRTKDCEALTYQ